MPRVRVSLPDELLERAKERGRELGKRVDELYAEALARYLGVNRAGRPGLSRGKTVIPRSSPQISVDLPDDLFRRAERLSKRLGQVARPHVRRGPDCSRGDLARRRERAGRGPRRAQRGVAPEGACVGGLSSRTTPSRGG
jgi:metal-responsive CopG/Arc/MetJ family transcriptional regulator